MLSDSFNRTTVLAIMVGLSAVTATPAYASTIDCLEVDPVIRIDGEDFVFGFRFPVRSGENSSGTVNTSASLALTVSFDINDLSDDPIDEIEEAVDEEVELELELRQDFFPNARWGGLTSTQTLLIDLQDIEDSSIQIFVGPGLSSSFTGFGPEVTYTDGNFQFGLRTFINFSGKCEEDPVTGLTNCAFDEATLTLSSTAVPLPPAAAILGAAFIPFGILAARRRWRKTD